MGKGSWDTCSVTLPGPNKKVFCEIKMTRERARKCHACMEDPLRGVDCFLGLSDTFEKFFAEENFFVVQDAETTKRVARA